MAVNTGYTISIISTKVLIVSIDLMKVLWCGFVQAGCPLEAGVRTTPHCVLVSTKRCGFFSPGKVNGQQGVVEVIDLQMLSHDGLHLHQTPGGDLLMVQLVW